MVYARMFVLRSTIATIFKEMHEAMLMNEVRTNTRERDGKVSIHTANMCSFWRRKTLSHRICCIRKERCGMKGAVHHPKVFAQ